LVERRRFFEEEEAMPAAASLQKMAQSSMSSGEFPAGLRVLVVDDDVTTLKIIERMSVRCHYRG
ncbi:two-component response regulator ARR2-like, partial [Trifolium medium]|nr:two-component response regulator ARR2-like [Trifolium medium]